MQKQTKWVKFCIFGGFVLFVRFVLRKCISGYVTSGLKIRSQNVLLRAHLYRLLTKSSSRYLARWYTYTFFALIAHFSNMSVNTPFRQTLPIIKVVDNIKPNKFYRKYFHLGSLVRILNSILNKPDLIQPG